MRTMCVYEYVWCDDQWHENASKHSHLLLYRRVPYVRGGSIRTNGQRHFSGRWRRWRLQRRRRWCTVLHTSQKFYFISLLFLLLFFPCTLIALCAGFFLLLLFLCALSFFLSLLTYIIYIIVVEYVTYCIEHLRHQMEFSPFFFERRCKSIKRLLRLYCGICTFYTTNLRLVSILYIWEIEM